MKYFIGFVIYFIIAVIGILIVLSFHLEFEVLIIPLLALIPIVFCGIGILGEEDSRNYFTERIQKTISKIYNFKNIMNFFSHKTVASRYKTLLYLFKRTHSSFYITRNEKSLVQFILGKNEGLQYWSLIQDFNVIYPLNEIVTITMNMKIEGHPIYIERDFHQSENQERMYNIVMEEFCQKFIQLCQKLEEEEIDQQQNNKGNETQNNKQTATKEEEITFIKEWHLLSFVKENGGKMCVANCTNKTTGNVFKACIISDGSKENRIYVSFYPELGELTPQEISSRKNELYIGKTEKGNYYLYSKDNENLKIEDTQSQTNTDKEEIQEAYKPWQDHNFGIDTLSVEQRVSLLGVAICVGVFPIFKNIQKEKIAGVLGEYRNILKLSNEDFESVHFKQFVDDKQHCFEVIKTIKKDGPFIIFLTTCNDLLSLVDSDVYQCQELKPLFESMGFTQEEINIIYKREFPLRYEGRKQ